MITPFISETRVVIISDDFYFLSGMYLTLSLKPGLFVESVFIYGSTDDISQDKRLIADRDARDNVLIIAVENVSIIQTIPEFPLFRTFVSLKNLKDRNTAFLFLNTIFMSRHLSVYRLYCFLTRKKGWEILRVLNLTLYEQHIVFSYFRMADKEALKRHLGLDIKSISSRKMAVFRKLQISSNAEAYYIIRAVAEIKVRNRVGLFYSK